MDEPTTGLHFADIEKLIDALQRLIKKDNSVIVIEHNIDFIKTADWIIDMGPLAGEKGGEIVAQGTIEDILKKNTPTAKALKDHFTQKKIKQEKKDFSLNIEVTKAEQNNLKNISVDISHNKITVFTGPSGSGKSSLAIDTIFAEGQRTLSRNFAGPSKKYN